MACVLTLREQAETSALARRVRGYSELIRLDREVRQVQAAGASPKLVCDGQTGRLRVVADK
jgi:hypothetical protein